MAKCAINRVEGNIEIRFSEIAENPLKKLISFIYNCSFDVSLLIFSNANVVNSTKFGSTAYWPKFENPKFPSLS